MFAIGCWVSIINELWNWLVPITKNMTKTLILNPVVQKTERLSIGMEEPEGSSGDVIPTALFFYYRQMLQFSFTSLFQSWITPMTSNPEWAFLCVTNMMLLPLNRIIEARVQHTGFNKSAEHPPKRKFFRGNSHWWSYGSWVGSMYT